MSEYKLIGEIVSKSKSDRWDEARLEWRIDRIFWETDPDTCLCGHFPINEMCYLRNIHNGVEVLVGNICVKKFLGLPSDKMFAAIKRVAKSIEKALNPEAIAYAHEKGWMNNWEKEFYFDTWRKRSLSARQMQKRIQINKKVLANVRDAR